MTTSAATRQAAEWFAERLKTGAEPLARAWERRIGAPPIEDVPSIIVAIAEDLERPDAREISKNAAVMQRASTLGVIRFRQRAPVSQVIVDYDVLGGLVDEFLSDEAIFSSSASALGAVLQAVRRVDRSIRLLQQRSVDAFAAAYNDALDRQNGQILRLSRIIAHEMRQPLGVLQLLPGVLPVREGDVELTHLLDVFDRNVRRLAEVASRLERLSHDTTIGGTVMSTEQRVDLNELVAAVVAKLTPAARDRDVRIQIDAQLPTVEVDPARLEIVFLNVIGNAIRYADGSKPARLVEVLTDHSRTWPAVLVRDNGIGMPAGRARHLFREFSRAHTYRDRDQAAHGLGLGLSIVRDCMDASGGIVHVESAEGAGTTVTLAWPPRARAT